MDEQQQDALMLCQAGCADRQVSRPPDQVTVTPLDGAAAPTGSPITLPATGCWHAARPIPPGVAGPGGQRQAGPPPTPDRPGSPTDSPTEPWVSSAASPASGPARPPTRAARRRGSP